jgi:integrase
VQEDEAEEYHTDDERNLQAAQELIPSNPVEVWKKGRGRRRSSAAHRVDPANVLDSKELDRFLGVAQSDWPDYVPFILFLADTGARLGEASALRWIDVDLRAGTARISRSFSDGKYVAPTKTGKTRTVELSTRLQEALRGIRPDLFFDESLAFKSASGGPINPHNFRARVFKRTVRKALGQGRRFTPHGLRHHADSRIMPRPRRWKAAPRGLATVVLDLESA